MIVTFFSVFSHVFQTCRDIKEMSGSKGRGGMRVTPGPGGQQGLRERWDLRGAQGEPDSDHQGHQLLPGSPCPKPLAQ